MNRIMLKETAKTAFKRNYWKCVLVALIFTIIVGSFSGSASKRNAASDTASHYSFQDVKEELRGTLTTVNVRIGLTGGLSLTLLSLFVFSCIEIGCDKFFLCNAEGDADLDKVLDGFRCNYGRNVLTMFLTRLFITLWCLLIIPGIIKAYAYMMVPYILAEDTTISRHDAMKLSQEMMRGHKMDAFILDLSFIGWYILTALTAGLVGIFYVFPYVSATKAEFYRSLRMYKRIEA